MALAVLAIAVSALSAPAEAVPLVLTFEGTIPVLTTQTQTDVYPAGGTATTTFTTTDTNNVAFSGSLFVDDSAWAVTTMIGSPSYPLRASTISDGANPPYTTVGIDTPELVHGTVTLGGGIGTLAFDRSLTEGADPAGATFPYQGETTTYYVDGDEADPFETVDGFGLGFSNGFAGYEPGVLPTFAGVEPGDVFFRGAFSFLYFFIYGGYDSAFVLHELFGPGAPSAFSWVDPDPGFCDVDFASCNDGFGTYSNNRLQYYTSQSVVLDEDFSYTSVATQYSGQLLLTRVELGPAPTSLPEPGMLALFAGGFGALALLRRKRRST